MIRRLVAPTVAVVSLSLMGCPPKYPKCENDEHCKEHNEVCVNGSCQECGKDQDCKPGFVCRDAKCTPKPECEADVDCQVGFKCKDQKCTPECAVNTDCPAGQQCKAGRCAPTPECLSDADCASGKKCDSTGRCSVPSVVGCALETVYFDFNEYAITPDAKSTLDRDAECLKARKGGAVTVAGHADERGTEEYNLHLGERRANAVKKYLVALGVDGAGLKVTSYGKERPADLGHDESAWAKNRRVELSETNR
jgi:peptidoglycan-associated lipoprotein